MQRRDMSRRDNLNSSMFKTVGQMYEAPAAPVHSLPEAIHPEPQAVPFKGKGMSLGKKPKGSALLGSIQKPASRPPNLGDPSVAANLGFPSATEVSAVPAPAAPAAQSMPPPLPSKPSVPPARAAPLNHVTPRKTSSTPLPPAPVPEYAPELTVQSTPAQPANLMDEEPAPAPAIPAMDAHDDPWANHETVQDPYAQEHVGDAQDDAAVLDDAVYYTQPVEESYAAAQHVEDHYQAPNGFDAGQSQEYEAQDYGAQEYNAGAEYDAQNYNIGAGYDAQDYSAATEYDAQDYNHTAYDAQNYNVAEYGTQDCEVQKQVHDVPELVSQQAQEQDLHRDMSRAQNLPEAEPVTETLLDVNPPPARVNEPQEPVPTPPVTAATKKQEPVDVEEAADIVAHEEPEAVKASVSDAETTPSVQLLIKERVSATGNREGGVDSLEVKGDLTLKISDAAQARLSVQMTASEHFGNSELQFRTHPHVDKSSWANDRRIALRDPKRPFPLNQPVGVLRWRAVTKEDATLPLSISVWVSPMGDGASEATIEYELENDALTLNDVAISIPVPAGVEPAVSDPENGAFEFDAATSRVTWRVPSIASPNASASLELSVPSGADNAEVFFPVSVDFTSAHALTDVAVMGVLGADSEAPLPFSAVAALVAENYLIH